MHPRLHNHNLASETDLSGFAETAAAILLHRTEVLESLLKGCDNNCLKKM